jgi:hypothetical protein
MKNKYMVYIEQYGETVALCNKALNSRRDAEQFASAKMKALQEVYSGYKQSGSFCKDGYAVLNNDITANKISLRITELKDGAEYLEEGLVPKDLKTEEDIAFRKLKGQLIAGF